MGAPPKKRLGELLVEAGVIDDHQLRAALGHQRQWGGKLGQTLVDLKLASEPQIVSALSRKLGYEVVKLDSVPHTAAVDAALKLVPGEVARRSNLVPIAADTHSVTIAMSDPTNLAATDDIAFRLGKRVKIVLAGDREVSRAVVRFYFPDQDVREEESIELDSVAGVAMTAEVALPERLQRQLSSRRDVDPAPRAAEVAVAMPLPGAPVAPAAPRPAAPPAGLRPVPEPSTASREAALRDALDRLAAGEESPSGLKSSRLVAALAKALLRRGLVTEAEIIVELTQRR